jgi:hypothetical protein
VPGPIAPLAERDCAVDHCIVLHNIWRQDGVVYEAIADGGAEERIATLNGWMAGVKTGERLTFTHKSDMGLQVNVIGAAKGVIKGGDFAKVFLAIWLGADPPNPEIKAGMLGCPLRVVTTC